MDRGVARVTANCERAGNTFQRRRQQNTSERGKSDPREDSRTFKLVKALKLRRCLCGGRVRLRARTARRGRRDYDRDACHDNERESIQRKDPADTRLLDERPCKDEANCPREGVGAENPVRAGQAVSGLGPAPAGHGTLVADAPHDPQGSHWLVVLLRLPYLALTGLFALIRLLPMSGAGKDT